MARSAGNPNQYLKKLGQTWYVSVRVPRTLEKLAGNTHIRRSLKTRDLSEANLRKLAAVASIKQELAALRNTRTDGPAPGFTFAEARLWREEFRQLQEQDDQETIANLEIAATVKAEEVESLYGFERAKKWFRTATVTSATLLELQKQYLEISEYNESTNMGHRKALAEVLEYLKNDDAHPEDITRPIAVKYIEESLTKRDLAYNTVRTRLAFLSGLWGWIESRGLLGAAGNPWSGHKVSKKANKGTTETKRAYTDAELLKLLRGTPEAKRWPTYTYLPDLLVLGMYTGCRAEEMCSAQVDQIAKVKGGYILTVKDAKTKAGNRPVGVTHPAAVAVLKRRIAGATSNAQVFPELSPGGADDRFSFAAVKAFGRYRRACGVPDGTDLHSLRRCAITQLERAGAGIVELARFVGHRVGTMAHDVYGEGASNAQTIETSRKIRYSKEVEAFVVANVRESENV